MSEPRVSGIRALLGTAHAPARPALGFFLNRTTAVDVRAWAERANVGCESRGHAQTTLHCGPLLRAALPGGDPVAGAGEARPPLIEELCFTFDAAGRLVTVDAFTRGLDPAAAAAAFAASEGHLARVLGPPSEQGASMARHRFSDYVAILSVSTLASGLAVRELYLSGS